MGRGLVMLFDQATIIAFILAPLTIYLAPGPNMTYIANNSMKRGASAGAWVAIGVTSGVWLQAFPAALGVTAIFKASPWAFEALRWIGVVYLCHLGIKVLRAGDVALGRVRQPALKPGN